MGRVGAGFTNVGTVRYKYGTIVFTSISPIIPAVYCLARPVRQILFVVGYTLSGIGISLLFSHTPLQATYEILTAGIGNFSQFWPNAYWWCSRANDP